MKPKILTTLTEYTKSLPWRDIIAGVTVAMVALPLSLAIAIASGADPAQGLVTAIIAGFVISLLGGGLRRGLSHAGRPTSKPHR